MCTQDETYQQAVHAVEDVLFKEDSSGTSRLGKEMNKHFYNTIGKWLIGGGFFILIGLAGAYYQIQYNTDLIEEGGRYTQEEADRDNINFQRQIDEMNRKLDVIIEQTRY